VVSQVIDVDKSTPRVPITIGIVGHRDVPAADRAPIAESIRRIVASYRDRFAHSDLLILTALAEGADQIAAEACRDIPGVRILAVLPMPADEYVDDFTSPTTLGEFKQSHAEAWAEVIVSDLTGTTGRTDLGEDRDASYQECARFISVNSHVLIAVWDGAEPDLPGGTADTVYYRVPGLVPLPYLRGQQIGSGHRAGITVHLPSSRESHGQPPNAIDGGPSVTTAMRLTGGRTWQAWLPSEPDPVATAIDEINQSIAATLPTTAIPSPAPVTSALMSVCDVAAGKDQSRFRRWAAGVLVLGVMALVLVGLQQKLTSLWVMLSVTLTLIIVGGLWWMLNRLDLKRRFQQQRVLAEGARVQEVWLSTGVSSSPADWYLQHQPEVSWIRTILRSAWLVDFASSPRQASGPDRLASIRESATSWIEGQLSYFQGTQGRRGALARNLSKSRLYSTVAVSALAVAIASLVPEVVRSLTASGNAPFLVFSQSLWELGLAVAAAATAYAELMAFREVSRRYAQSIELFRSGLAQLSAMSSAPDESRSLMGIQDVVTEVGKEALQETSAWFATSYDRSVRPV